jgi:alpha-glucosidase
MRIVNPKKILLGSVQPEKIIFRGQEKETFQITVVEEDVIRVQHFPDGQPRMNRTWSIVGKDGDIALEGRLRDDLSPFSLPGFKFEQQEHRCVVTTSQLQVEIDTGDISLIWRTMKGEAFAADLQRRAYAYDAAGETVYHYMQRRADEHYYGFGERSGALDKSGRRMRMVNLDALGYNAEMGDPLYKHIPFYVTYVADLNLAYGLFYDNLSTAIFDMGQEKDNYYGPYRYYQAEAGDLDYYLIYGPDIAAVVQKFSKMIGRIALPPRWSLGYFGSSMLYTDAQQAQQELKKYVQECEEHNIPCDMFHLSSGYGSGTDGKRYVFNWNFEKIPNPREMLETFHQAGMHVMANIKPCLLDTHPRYAEVRGLGAFVKDSQSETPRVDYFWGGYGSHLDFTNPAAYAWWRDNVRTWLLDYGVDATWNDNNEYPIWDDEARCFGFGEEIKIKYIRPLHSLLMVRASLEAQRAFHPEQRPFLLSRSASPGTQRYAQTWSGDNETSWNTLRYNIPMGLGMGLSGFPNIGHDVGGFAGPQPSAELLVRWVQNGVFHPRFTIHSWNSDGTVNEPWMYPEVLPIIRETIEFRYRLLPYLYSLFFAAYQTGTPIIHPLVYQFPQDPNCQTESFDFMLGDQLLVASVLEKGARERDVYLPRGKDWCDFYTGQHFHGGQTVTLAAPLERIPLLVTAGSILPFGKVMGYVGEEPDDLRQIYLFPHQRRGRGQFTLIEDDGVSLGYQRGEFTEIHFTLNAEPDELHLEIQFGKHGYRLPYTQMEVILPPGETRQLRVTCVEGITTLVKYAHD